MRSFLTLMLISSIAFMSWQCSSTAMQEGTVLEGNLKNAQNLQVYLDYVVIGKANSIISKAEIDGSGNFSMAFPEGLTPGIYNLRIGAKKINLIFDGTEKQIVISGDLNTMQNYALQVNGSNDSQVFINTMQALLSRSFSSEDISNFIDTTSNPLMGAFIAYRALGNQPQFLDIQKKAQAKLAAADPNSVSAQEYGKFLNLVQGQYASMMSSQLINVGQPAPDIQLKSPDGKEFALSDLKGNVVLLDFWASWCGPCRRENPNVVKVYDKYKDKGFTVFSVSLDGLDSRGKASLQTEAQVNQMIDRSRERWVQAIAQDNLKWEYHVSDLKKWESAPAATYGVRGIPKTFLIDREGKIAEVGLRGAQQIEAALQKHL